MTRPQKIVWLWFACVFLLLDFSITMAVLSGPGYLIPLIAIPVSVIYVGEYLGRHDNG